MAYFCIYNYPTLYKFYFWYVNSPWVKNYLSSSSLSAAWLAYTHQMLLITENFTEAISLASYVLVLWFLVIVSVNRSMQYNYNIFTLKYMLSMFTIYQAYWKCSFDTNMTAILRIALTDLEPNIEYILGLTNYNGIRTHSSQHMIRIHCHVPNITRVRLPVDLYPVCPIPHGSSARTVQQY